MNPIIYRWNKRGKIDDPDVVLVQLTEEKTSYIKQSADRQRILCVGIGDRKEVTLRRLHLIVRQVVATAKAQRVKKIAIDFKDFVFSKVPLKNKELAEVLGINFDFANFDFVLYKTMPPDGWSFIEEIYIGGSFGIDVEAGIERGRVIVRAVNDARTSSKTPTGEMTPTRLAESAQAAAEGLPIRVQVLDRDDMKILKMGGVLGVAQGSSEEPKFIVMEYSGGGKKDKPFVLVGKGVTFDSGGLNLKPSQHIYEMHMDMSGGSAVINTIALAARLKLKRNVIALVPAVENMPSGSSYRPGDLLRTMSGKTIEVLDTDAEGRVILSDALTYAEQYQPKLVVDVATLTGAAAVALGQRASGIFTKDEKLARLAQELGEEAGDYVWPLPLWDEFEDEIKGTFGDWANVGRTRYGGASTGAIFLYQFAKNYPWLHIDIAPTMTSIDGQFLAKGATGVPVRLLLKLLEQF